MNENDHSALISALRRRDLASIQRLLATLDATEIARLIEREDSADRAVLYRLLPRECALNVFSLLDSGMQSDLFQGLRSEDVALVFEGLDPDDRAQMVEELPAEQAHALMRGLSPTERSLTASLLGYAAGSVGRRMSPEFVCVEPQLSLADAFEHVARNGSGTETLYTLPITDGERRLLGVISLREVLLGARDAPVAEAMQTPLSVRTTDDAETASRRLVEARLLAMPVVDASDRVVGMLTIDTALHILEEADDEDAARQGASEPLGFAYLAAPVLRLVRSRVVWLLVLAVSALLTVQVLGAFEDALEQVVTLALFIPLLTGTAGNAGAQAATTVTRALATGEVTARDALSVAWRELRVGVTLGSLLGVLGFVVAGVVYDVALAAVIGLTLLSVCTLAAAVGGVMPIVAKRLGADPAVFSTPFISTFCDATSLLIYFLIATSLMGL